MTELADLRVKYQAARANTMAMAKAQEEALEEAIAEVRKIQDAISKILEKTND